MKTKTPLAMSIGALFLLATSAPSVLAQSGGALHFEKPQFANWDTDKVGKVTRDEFDAARLERFQQADADNDGKLTFDEMEARREALKRERLTRRFDTLNIDFDGTVSKSEFTSPMRDVFAILDRNGDDTLTEEEESHRKHGKFGGPTIE